MHTADIEIARCPLSLSRGVGEDTGLQAVVAVICQVDGFIEGVVRHDCHHRAEHFFTMQPHVGGHIRDDRGFDESAGAAAADDHCCAGRPGVIDDSFDPFCCRLGEQRPDVRIPHRCTADTQRTNKADEAFLQFIAARTVNVYALDGDARLSGSRETTGGDASRSMLDVR